METVFYKCPVCGNVMTLLVSSGVTPICCGRPMKELEANTVDAKTEAHVPVVKCEKMCGSEQTCYKVTVTVGSVTHPSTPEHHICFVYLETQCGGEVKLIKEGKEPVATFFTTSKPLMAYAYCNLHQLWKSPVSCQ